MRPGGSGDVASSHVAWTFAQGPDVPTPVSDGKLLYVIRDNGVVFALDVKTGQTVYGPERLPSGNYSASPILADGKIYVTTEEEGLTTVFKAGPKFEILSSNSLLDDCSPYCLSTVAIWMASYSFARPPISGRLANVKAPPSQILQRGHRKVACSGNLTLAWKNAPSASPSVTRAGP